MHSNSLLSPGSTSPGCSPPVQLIGQIASRLILPVYLFPEHSIDVFITLIKAKSNMLRMIVTCAMTAATSPMDRLKLPSIAYMLFYYFHLLLTVIPQLFVEPMNKLDGFQSHRFCSVRKSQKIILLIILLRIIKEQTVVLILVYCHTNCLVQQ